MPAAAVPGASLSTQTTPSADAMLATFLASPSTLQAYRDAVGRFLAACKEAKHSALSLEKFKQACARNAPTLTLPGSLQWRLTSNAKLPDVTTDPSILKDAVASLQRIEREASEAAYKVLLETKNRHLAHLQQRANMQHFIASELQQHRLAVEDIARELASFGSALLPVDRALRHFEQHLHTRLAETALEAATQAQERRREETAARAADLAAQENVMNGAHTGETINKLIARKLTPVHDSIRKLMNKQTRPQERDDRPSDSSAARPKQSHKRRRDQREHEREPSQHRPARVTAHSHVHPSSGSFIAESNSRG